MWPPTHTNYIQLPENVKYLWLHIHKTETTGNDPQQTGLLGCKSKLSTSNKFIIYIYKAILKLIWPHRIQLSGMASTSNTDTLEWFQSKAFCMTVEASWFVPNIVIRSDLQTPTVNEEICHYISRYSVCLSVHPNDLALNIVYRRGMSGKTHAK
jgi:hypothetical protein